MFNYFDSLFHVILMQAEIFLACWFVNKCDIWAVRDIYQKPNDTP